MVTQEQQDVIEVIETDLHNAWAEVQSLTVGWGPTAIQQLEDLAVDIERLAT